MDSVQIIQDSATAATLFSPARMRILEMLASPDSASGIARKLALPRQQVGYHLRELEQAGLLELVEERRKGNCTERVVRAAARSYVISPLALGKLGGAGMSGMGTAAGVAAGSTAAGSDALRDRFSAAYLVALAARAIRDIASICTRAEKAGKRVSTMALEVEVRFATPEARARFGEELARDVAKLVAKYHDESTAGGRRFRFFGGVYPAITREMPHDSSSVKIN